MPQPKSVRREVRLENQPKTSAPPGRVLVCLGWQELRLLRNLPYETFRYARPPPMSKVGTRPYHGRPILSAFCIC
jgi:hypothetical protein